MTSACHKIEELRVRISNRNESDLLDRYGECLAVTRRGDGFDLAFHGSPFGEPYIDLLTTLASSDVAGFIRSLSISGPDEGANGTKNWDLEPLLASRAVFEQLDSFSIELDLPANHNRAIIANSYDEDGIIAKLLERSPQLRHLQVPSAPDVAFFGIDSRPMQFLSVDAGFDTQDFIFNLSRASNLPLLRYLEWGEYHETSMADWRTRCTPFDAYQNLFQSAAFEKITRFVWRNPACTASEIKELKAMRNNLQLLIVQQEAHYA